eukprot:78674_1
MLKTNQNNAECFRCISRLNGVRLFTVLEVITCVSFIAYTYCNKTYFGYSIDENQKQLIIQCLLCSIFGCMASITGIIISVNKGIPSIVKLLEVTSGLETVTSITLFARAWYWEFGGLITGVYLVEAVIMIALIVMHICGWIIIRQYKKNLLNTDS